MDNDYIGYGLQKWSPKINHLSNADDTILFGLGECSSIRQMMNILRRYKVVSGETVNKSKSQFYLHEKAPLIFSI